jgi:hypothetical protein
MRLGGFLGCDAGVVCAWRLFEVGDTLWYCLWLLSRRILFPFGKYPLIWFLTRDHFFGLEKRVLKVVRIRGLYGESAEHFIH